MQFIAPLIITLFLLLPIALAENTFRGSSVSTMSGFKSKLTGVPTTRVEETEDPCNYLIDIGVQCFSDNGLTSADVESCIDCVGDLWPEGDQVLCTDFHDFACNGPAVCSSCGQCHGEVSDWLICIYENAGCPPRDCPGAEPSDPTDTCPGGNMVACIGMCAANCDS